MTCNTYLVSIAKLLILSDDEKASIDCSISTLQSRLDSWFGTKSVIEHFKFGSSERETILPRKADPDSDIDYMVVFDNSDNCKPDAYLARLKRFAEKKYKTSEVYRDHPTTVLELNHIKFELVPAITYYGWSDYYQIPAETTSYIDWTLTRPMDIVNRLNAKNNQHHYQIKRLVRLLKYWNVLNGKVYSSYELEEYVISHVFFNCTSLENYFYEAVRHLPEGGLPEYKRIKVERLKNKIQALAVIKLLNEEKAVESLMQVLPVF